MKTLAIVADTAVDTAMGAAFFHARGYETLSFPTARTAEACAAFFRQPPEAVRAHVAGLLRQAIASGAEAVVVYANTLCANVDMEQLGRELSIPVFTPFQVYRQLGTRYRSLAVWAASAEALVGIEGCLKARAPGLQMQGYCRLALAAQIEAGLSPSAIAEAGGLAELARVAARSGAEAILLGCTHFPYLLPALEGLTSLPVIDPAEELLRLVEQAL